VTGTGAKIWAVGDPDCKGILKDRKNRRQTQEQKELNTDCKKEVGRRKTFEFIYFFS
jgi:hypothetical protein